MKTKEEIEATFKDAPYYAYKEGLQDGFNESFNSIRTQAAIAAMQSILNKFDRLDTADMEAVAKLSVRQANALIHELQK